MKLNFIDIFSGCGGLSLGLRNAGLIPTFSIESDPDAFATYRHNLINGNMHHNWPKWLPMGPNDIQTVIEKYAHKLRKLQGHIDLVAGGPPCQGFSMNGRRDPADPRNGLVDAYLSFIEIIRPKVVLFENVRGFRSMSHTSGKTYEEYVVSSLSQLGYDVHVCLLDASEYGIPQRRNRFFVTGIQTGSLSGVDPFLRLKVYRHRFLAERGLSASSKVTVMQAIADLQIHGRSLEPYPDCKHSGFQRLAWVEPRHPSPYVRLMRISCSGIPSGMRLAKHQPKTVAFLARILSECKLGRSLSLEDRKRLQIRKRSIIPMCPDQPAPTVTTLPDDLIHPTEPRAPTLRELARLQSFPDWFEFQGPYTTGGKARKGRCPKFTQVGNAVPPLLAEALGLVIRGLTVDMTENSRTDCLHIAEMSKKVFSDLRKIGFLQVPT